MSYDNKTIQLTIQAMGQSRLIKLRAIEGFSKEVMFVVLGCLRLQLELIREFKARDTYMRVTSIRMIHFRAISR